MKQSSIESNVFYNDLECNFSETHCIDILNKNIDTNILQDIIYNHFKNNNYSCLFQDTDNNSQEQITEEDNAVRGEFALWRSVILQAFMDLAGNSKRTEDIVAKRKALLWFSMFNQDFLTICDYANLDPAFVYKKAQLVISITINGSNGITSILKQMKL